MLCPFLCRARHAAGALRGDDRLFEIGCVPLGNCARHGVAILRDAQYFERCRTMVRKIAVQIAPAAIPARIDAHDAVARRGDLAIAQAHVVPAAQRCRRLAQIHCHLLTPPGAKLPQFSCRESARSHRCRARHADAERRRQHRIGAARKRDGSRKFVWPTGDRKDCPQSFMRHGQDLRDEDALLRVVSDPSQ